MTPRRLKTRLALLLGLPLFPACKEAPPPEAPRAPITEPKSTDAATAAASTPDAGKGGVANTAAATCALDEVHEFVCGRIDNDSTDPKAGAAAPFGACTVDARPLAEFDDFLFIDSSRVGRADPSLATFKYDARRTQAYHYGGTIRAEDTFCCYERCAPLPIPKAPRGAVPAGLFVQEKCVPAPERGPSKPAKGAPQCPEAVNLAIDTRENPGPFDAAPFARTNASPSEACCYSVATPRRCPTDMYESHGECKYPTRGRPLRDGGTLVTASVAARGDWRDAIALHTEGEGAGTRARAARAWTREGAAEHASVAAFARLTLELMAVGAPAALVGDACRAARDEVRHATLAYGIASALGGSDVGPGALAMSTGAASSTLSELATASFLDGCVEETVAAMCAAEAGRRSHGGSIADALQEITEDETRHAELAYRILAWTLGRDASGEIHAAIRGALDDVRRATPAPEASDPAADALEPFGILSAASTAAVRAQVLTEVVIPCVEALLAREGARPSRDGSVFEQA